MDTRKMKSGRHIDHWQDKLDQDLTPPAQLKNARSRVMYIEDKSEGLEGDARIGRVYFSKSGKSLYYRDRMFQSLKGAGFKANYFDVKTGDQYWVSGPHKDLNDRLYGGNMGVEVDADVHDEYRKILYQWCSNMTHICI